jgi:DNA-binding MarR family transcriptional regulator
MQRTLPNVDELTDELMAFLTHLVKSAEHDVFHVAAELDLTLTQLRTLFVLGTSDHELALTELATHVGLSVAATGRAVDVLVREGLLTRHEDAVDRRIKRIGVGEAGHAALARLAAARRDGLRTFVGTLADEEREHFSTALAPVLERPEVQAGCTGTGR